MSVDPISALPSRPSPGVAGARLGTLYANHSRMVYGICRMLLRDADEAEDATQQVFLSAYRNLLTGTEVRDPAAWLGTIARNACRRRATVRLREPLAVADLPTLVSPGVDEQASSREETAALYAELAALPEKQREAVVLRDLYGLHYDEVATALGTSRPAVEALLFRGRRRLQRRLRTGFAAGVLVVPLAVQESIAYAVPGFARTAGPAGAAATAAGVSVLAKLAAAGAAVGLAGSAGVVVVAERSLHDPPLRPAGVWNEQPAPLGATDSVEPPSFLPILAGGFPIVGGPDDDEDGQGEDGEQADSARAAGEVDDEDRDDNRGNAGEDAMDEREDSDARAEDDSDADDDRPSSRNSGAEFNSEVEDAGDAEEPDEHDTEDELDADDGDAEQQTADD